MPLAPLPDQLFITVPEVRTSQRWLISIPVRESSHISSDLGRVSWWCVGAEEKITNDRYESAQPRWAFGLVAIATCSSCQRNQLELDAVVESFTITHVIVGYQMNSLLKISDKNNPGNYNEQFFCLLLIKDDFNSVGIACWKFYERYSFLNSVFIILKSSLNNSAECESLIQTVVPIPVFETLTDRTNDVRSTEIYFEK